MRDAFRVLPESFPVTRSLCQDMFSPVALLIVGIMSGLVSMAVFGSLLRSGIPGLSRWFGANILIMVTLGVLALNGRSTAALNIVIASALIAGAALVAMQGCRQFFGLRPSRLYELLAYAILVLGLLHWTYASPNVNARIVLMSVFLGYVRLVVAWTAYSRRPPHRPGYSYNFVALLALLGALVHVARALSTGFGWEHQTHFLDSTPMNIAFLGLGILTLPCLAIGMVMIAYDRMAERMERLATIDELTGALVRREFMAQAGLRLDHANRTKSCLAVAILDIDNFKAINDGHGHAAGDRTLSHFSSVIAQGIRQGDIFGRLGGEEFAIVLPATSRADAVAMMNRLRLQIAASTLAVSHGGVACTFSAGIDEYQSGDTLANLLARADSALYSAKAMGRNRVVAALSVDDQAVAVCRDAPKAG